VRIKAVECGGASTTSAGAWHLGLLQGWDEGDAASAWLSRVLNADVVAANAKKEEASNSPALVKLAEFRLVRAAGVRALATYAGPKQVPFSDDVSLQRLGAASPFKMQRVPVRAHGVDTRKGQHLNSFSQFCTFPACPLFSPHFLFSFGRLIVVSIPEMNSSQLTST